MSHEPPDYYIYAADVYCEKCGKDTRKRIKREGRAPRNPQDQTTYDSGEYPKGPFSDEESDTPHHCGSGEHCLDPLIIDGEKYGKFLENPLTSEGERYVREEHRDSPSKLTEMWMKFYELTPDEEETEDDE